MQRVKVGKVVFYNQDKSYGFVLSDDGEKCFFHLSDGGHTKVVEDNILVFEALQRRYVLKHPPKLEDMLFYTTIIGNKGPKASSWFILPQGNARDILLSKETIYRFMKYIHVPGTDYLEENAVCEYSSNDLLKIVVEYPRSKTSRFSCGDFDTHEWCETPTSNGHVKVTDPRPFII